LERIAGMSDKVLTQALDRLRARGLIARQGNDERAPGSRGVVYELSPLGESFANGPLAQLAQWAAANQAELIEPTTTS
jgi:DNA-binding HxlR family transcriptional regulator